MPTACVTNADVINTAVRVLLTEMSGSENFSAENCLLKVVQKIKIKLEVLNKFCDLECLDPLSYVASVADPCLSRLALFTDGHCRQILHRNEYRRERWQLFVLAALCRNAECGKAFFAARHKQLTSHKAILTALGDA